MVPRLGLGGGPGDSLVLHQLSACGGRQPLAVRRPGHVVDANLGVGRDRRRDGPMCLAVVARMIAMPSRVRLAMMRRSHRATAARTSATSRPLSCWYPRRGPGRRPTSPAGRSGRGRRRSGACCGPAGPTQPPRGRRRVRRRGRPARQRGRATCQGLGARGGLLADGQVPAEDVSGVTQAAGLRLRGRGLLLGRAAHVAQHSEPFQ